MDGPRKICDAYDPCWEILSVILCNGVEFHEIGVVVRSGSFVRPRCDVSLGYSRDKGEIYLWVFWDVFSGYIGGIWGWGGVICVILGDIGDFDILRVGGGGV